MPRASGPIKVVAKARPAKAKGALKPPPYKPDAGSADHGATPASPVRAEVKPPKGTFGVKAKVKTYPNVASYQAAQGRKGHVAQAAGAAAQAAIPKGVLNSFDSTDHQDGVDQKLTPAQRAQVKAIDRSAKAAARTAAKQTDRQLTKRDNADIKDFGQSAEQPAQQDKAIHAQLRRLSPRAAAATEKIPTRDKTVREIEKEAVRSRGGSRLDVQTTDRVVAAAQRVKARQEAAHPEDHRSFIDNAVHDVTDTVTGAPTAAALIGKAGFEVGKAAVTGRGTAPTAAKLVKGIAKGPIGKLAHGDVKGALHDAVTHPVTSALTVAGGSGAVLRGLRIAHDAAAVAATTRSTSGAVRAARMAEQARRGGRAQLSVTVGGKTVAAKARDYSAHPAVRGVQKVTDRMRANDVSGRRARRIVRATSRHATDLKQAAGHVREHAADLGVVVGPQHTRAELAAARAHGRATRKVARATGLAPADVKHGLVELYGHHIDPQNVAHTLQQRIDATAIAHDAAHAAGERDRAARLAVVHDRLTRLQQAEEKGKGALSHPDLQAAAVARQAVSHGQTARRIQEFGLDPTAAQRRLQLQIAVARGLVHHSGEHFVHSVSGERVKAGDLEHLGHGGYLPDSTEAAALEPTGKIHVADAGHGFTGNGLLETDHGHAGLADLHGRIERGISAQALRNTVVNRAIHIEADHTRALGLAKQARDASGVPFVVKEVSGQHKGWAVLPKALGESFDQHVRQLGKAGRAGRAVNRQFLRAVLPLSAAWHAGNYVDTKVRLALMGHRASHDLVQQHLHDELARHGMAQDVLESVGGAHFAAQSTRAPAIARDAGRVKKALHGMGRIQDAALQPFFNAARAPEARLTRHAQGTAAVQQARQLGIAVRDQRELAKQLATHWRKDPALVEDFQRRTLAIVGDYIHHPQLIAGMDPRAIAPFVQWLKASTKFVLHTLPTKHPMKAALFGLGAMATDQQRRELGLSSQISADQARALGYPAPAQGFTAGAIGLGPHTKLPTTPFTSFGAVAGLLHDPAKVVGDAVLPGVERPLGRALGFREGAATAGLHLLEDRLLGPHIASDGSRRSRAQRLTSGRAGGVAGSALEAFAPGAKVTAKAMLGGKRPAPGSNLFNAEAGATPKSGPGSKRSAAQRALAVIAPVEPTDDWADKRQPLDVAQYHQFTQITTDPATGKQTKTPLVINTITGKETPGKIVNGQVVPAPATAAASAAPKVTAKAKPRPVKAKPVKTASVAPSAAHAGSPASAAPRASAGVSGAPAAVLASHPDVQASAAVFHGAQGTGGIPKLGHSQEVPEADIAAAAAKHGIDARIFHNLVIAESNGRKDAVSPAGARGPTQLMPATAAGLGVKVGDYRSELDGGAKYLAQLLHTFHGDYRKAVMAYNAGPAAVSSGAADRYPETVAYVKKILGGSDPHAIAHGQISGGSDIGQAILAGTGRSIDDHANALARLDAVNAFQRGQISAADLASALGPPTVTTDTGLPLTDAPTGTAQRIARGTAAIHVNANANRKGVNLQKPIVSFLQRVAGTGVPITVGTGTNHNRLTVDGNVSDHWDGNAGDILVGGRDTRLGDQIAANAIAIAGRMPLAQAMRLAKAGGIHNFQTPQGRVQIIWRTYQGGDHHNHVHIGLNPSR